MIVLKDKNKVYLVESIYTFSTFGRLEHCLVEENVPIFRMKGSTAIAGSDSCANVDDFRYVRIPVPKQLNLVDLKTKTMPRIKQLWRDMGRDDEDGRFERIVIAKDDKAFVYNSNDVLIEIDDAYAIGLYSEAINYALKATKGLSVQQRVRKVYQYVQEMTGAAMFPLFVMDTVSKKLQIIEEEKK